MREFDRALGALRDVDSFTYVGRVNRVVGLTLEGYLPSAQIGATCTVHPHGAPAFRAEVVGLKDDRALLMPLGNLKGVAVGTEIRMSARKSGLRVGPSCLGRVLNGLGEPLDGLGPLKQTREVPLLRPALNPLERRSIKEPLDLGVRAVNAVLTAGEGQRIALVAGAGVGKSTL
ncbi:MAG: EscN/YscN/HrcN family type III secretion system ATPase, partial [Myxococcales bacterium]|nr:EscN/YscN/HrcN family type III secretion system ATPase [Myxococcales bacterium]